MPAVSNPLRRHSLAAPQFGVAWEPRRMAWLADLRAVVFGAGPDRKPAKARFFQDQWLGPRFPARELGVSALLHVALVIFPYAAWQALGLGPSQPRREAPELQLTWYGPARDLPLIAPPAPRRAKPAARKPAPKPPEVAQAQPQIDAFHPRQTILSTPLRPNHPRQTLIQPEAPPEAPKVLPPLPNIVQWSDVRPARPKLQISREELARLRPRVKARRRVEDLPMPAAPNLERQVGDLNIAASEPKNARPQLPMMPASVPVAGPRRDAPEVGAAPDVGASLPVAGAGEGLQRLVALSAAPAPPAPVEVPPGNLSARFAVSPEGPQPGTGGAPTVGNGSSGTGSGSSGGGPPDVAISGGSPSSPVAGAAAPASTPKLDLPAKPEARSRLEPGLARPRLTMPAPRAALDGYNPPAPPEAILGQKRVYTLHVNMPNLTSATGSWILRFAELDAERLNAAPTNGDPPGGELAAPVPLRKVDPRYPPALVSARVEGEVVLYAIIRKDGSVDSIQVMRSVEPQLDRNAVDALARWKFRPAERNGAAIDLEAVVIIPFRAVAPL